MKSGNKKKLRKSFSFHPILFGLYPVLTLYSFNINEIVFSGIWQALITSLVIACGVAIFFMLVFRVWEKAAVFASLTILMFFSYGHIFDFVGGLNENFSRHRFFIPTWILVFLVSVYLLWRYRNVSGLTRVLNTVSLVLVVAVSVQILAYALQSGSTSRNAAEVSAAQQEQNLHNSADRDVYYILVDSFGREDLLADEYKLDISEFISQLEQIGFYIPECTQSNYDHTLQSLTSSLNMQYLEALGLDYFDNKEKFTPLIQHSQVREQFEALGYSTVTFKSLYPSLDITDSSYYYDYFKDETGSASLASLNFQYLFLRTTLLRPAVEILENRPDIVIPSAWSAWIPVNNTLESRDYRQYQQNVFALDMLETMPDLPPKKFVYAHLYTTHQPFVFYPDGSFHPFLPQNRAAYKDQVVFTTGRLLQIVKTILEKSKTPPIIIIQGDHSYSKLDARVKILNAYYFPDGGDRNLYSTITPVNSFRVLFDTYFGGTYQLLPDISRYVDPDDVLHEVPSTCIR